MRRVQFLSAALGVGLAVAALSAGPAAATSSAVAGYSDPANSAESPAETRAFFDAVMESARKRGALDDMGQGFAVTLTYSDGGAPSFQDEIAEGAGVWNGVLTAVQLQEVSSGGDFTVSEGDDRQIGSNARVTGLGKGAIFLDRQQVSENDPVRVVAHEMGHVLGLPDIRSGLCSELMSGGSAGTSCRSSQPNAEEIAKVEENFGGSVDPGTRAPDNGATGGGAATVSVGGGNAGAASGQVRPPSPAAGPSEVAPVSTLSLANGAGTPGGADAKFPPGVVSPSRG